MIEWLPLLIVVALFVGWVVRRAGDDLSTDPVRRARARRSKMRMSGLGSSWGAKNETRYRRSRRGKQDAQLIAESRWWRRRGRMRDRAIVEDSAGVDWPGFDHDGDGL